MEIAASGIINSFSTAVNSSAPFLSPNALCKHRAQTTANLNLELRHELLCDRHFWVLRECNFLCCVPPLISAQLTIGFHMTKQHMQYSTDLCSTYREFPSKVSSSKFASDIKPI